MPELPEVETTKRGIEPYLLNNKFIDCWYSGLSLRFPFQTKKFQLIQNQKIEKIDRIAKYIVMQFANKNRLVIHLGMTGNLRIAEEISHLKHDHIVLALDNSTHLIYNDSRRFGLVTILTEGESFNMLDNNAEDPFGPEMTPNHFYKIIKNRTSTIKSILLNNKIISGIGNIYASEVLFQSHISPFRLGKDMNLADCKLVIDNSKKVLKRAIKSGGTTLKDYYNAEAKPGYFKIKLKVYDRENQKCKVCDELVLRVSQNNRSTFYCPNCQKS